ncbi:oligopeptide transport system permease protein [Mycoplasma testudineum]|uniref:Oligopeptide transport system permease protein n=1 Tax=Mycoplasma testudineum TaxID=244584 RepID=A0A4R6IDL8_9MOLU|nr:ABC transporter permease [Mycoplasma testudineum]OYD26829.1 peptide ABC transporter permease [Mycoplasma testudineum]TDO20363.1 oligopeptide transport system permease protein [Mycoplasma testudineum]
MTSYILKRLGLAILSLFLLTFLTYIIVAIFAPNPLQTELQGAPTAEQIEQINIRIRELGLLDNPISRYFRWFGNIFNGDVGQIYSSNTNTAIALSIPEEFFNRIPYTLRFVLPSFIISTIAGVLLGLLAAYNRGKWLDHGTQIFTRLFVSLPSFVIAPFFFILYARVFNWFENFQTLLSNGQLDNIFSDASFKIYFFPVIIVTLISMAGYASVVRNNTVDILKSNYVLIARSKGLNEFEVFFKYVLRNSGIPLISVILPSFTVLLGGSFVIESLFGITGSSQIIISYFRIGEINVIMFNSIFYGSISIVMAIILDLAFVIVDPRIRIAKSSEINTLKKLSLKIKRQNFLIENTLEKPNNHKNKYVASINNWYTYYSRKLIKNKGGKNNG